MSDPWSLRRFEFIEAPAFSRYRDEHLDEDGMLELQWTLMMNPDAGDVIPGAGGIRKLRWRDSRRGKGKRGGLRVIYYCFLADGQILLLTLYDKNEANDLTASQKETLRLAMEAERTARRERRKR